MSLLFNLDLMHALVRGNKWHRLFSIFCRVSLAAGFLPSGYVKIAGERFTDLAVNHPMGHYLDALYQTGFYYTFIGVLQMGAAILLLIPRTATLGAVIYFPLILNIFILTLSTRFVGSLLSSPLMVLANLYLLCWDYHKLKFMLPFNYPPPQIPIPKSGSLSNRFPIAFFSGVVVTIFLVGLTAFNAFNIQPFNTLPSCQRQCPDSSKPTACYEFCDCIHTKGRPLNECLEVYNKAPEEVVKVE